MLDLVGAVKDRLNITPENVVVTPFMELNRFTNGGLCGFTVLGGGPKAGKSTFAMNCALTAAEFGIPVLYVDMEHSWVFLTLKFMASQTRRTIESVKEILKTQTIGLPKYLHALTFWEGRLLPKDIVFNISTLARENQQSLVVIDSIQKLPTMPGADHRSSINLWLRELEAIKNQFPVTYLIISELSRGEDGKNYDQPGRTSYKESGDIEYTAEQSFFLYPAGQDGLFKLALKYSRFGPAGLIPALYSQRDFAFWRWIEIPKR